MPVFPALPAAACALAAVLLCAPAAAQQKATLKRVTLSSLTAQGFEVKAALHEALMLQKGAEVYWCNLRLADTSPLSYQSDCFAVR
jgi:hypothetical protein